MARYIAIRSDVRIRMIAGPARKAARKSADRIERMRKRSRGPRVIERPYAHGAN